MLRLASQRSSDPFCRRIDSQNIAYDWGDIGNSKWLLQPVGAQAIHQKKHDRVSACHSVLLPAYF